MTTVSQDSETTAVLMDWLVVDAVLRNRSPVVEFPSNRENNREFLDIMASALNF